MAKKIYNPRCPEYRVYEDEIQARKLNSKILNRQNNRPGVHMLFFDKQGIKDQILNLKGNENGVTKFDSLNRPLELSVIAWINLELAEVEQKFKSICENAKLQGREAPEKMPSDLLKQKVLSQAKKYVSELELEKLEEMLKSFSDLDQEKNRSFVLKSGPVGAIQLRGGLVNQIDGMKCKEITAKGSDGQPEKVMIISDLHPLAKPFNGYKVSDYRKHICRPWLIACEEQASKNYKEMIEKKTEYSKFTNAQKNGSSVPWPAMPESCKRYSEKIKETSKI